MNRDQPDDVDTVIDNTVGDLQAYTSTKSGFFLAHRRVSMLPAAMSLAASWIWVQALFVSTGQAWQNGWVGLFWFTFANGLALVLFAPFVKKLVQRVPDGYTVSGYYRERFSRRVQLAVGGQYVIHAIGGMVANLLVGAGLISLITGWNGLAVTVGIALTAYAYTAFAGMKASVVTDWLMYLFIVLAALAIVPLAVSAVGGISNLDYNGVSDVTGFLGGGGLELMLLFGIPVSLVLLSGPLTEQMYWSRGWAAARRADPFKVAMLAALLFVIVPITLGFLGFAAATMNIQVDDLTHSGIAALNGLVDTDPMWAAAIVPYAGIAICGVLSSADSMFNSVGNTAGHDIAGFDSNDRRAVAASRIGMTATLIIAVAWASIPGMDFIWVWFFYGAVRIATMVPTMFALGARHDRVTESGMFWGIIAGFLVGVPLLLAGNLLNNPALDAAGVIGALIASAAVLLLISYTTRPDRADKTLLAR